jgi:ABC-2 type transport system ATP-binding protein
VVTVDHGQLEAGRGVLGGLASGPIEVDEHTRTLVAPVASGSTALIEAVRGFDEAGVHVLDLAMRRPTLDDVFLQLTGHHAEADGAPGSDDAPASTTKGVSR